MMKQNIEMKKYLFITILSLFSFVELNAQPGHGGDGGGGHEAPIDGGIVALVIVGAVYGIKRNLKE